ncbi:unnamed protein product, partial [marine sediment metagenome]
MGYTYKVVSDEKGGEMGICILPDGSEVSAWDFYRGKVGKEYSYCTQKDYLMETKIIQKDSYVIECPVCVDKDKGTEVRMLELMEMNNEPLIIYERKINKSNVIYENATPNPNLSTLKSLPISFDWRNRDGHAYIGGIRNQGDCGSCYAFAAVAAAEGTFNWKNHFRDDCRFKFSESFIMWCLGRLPQYNDNFYGCDGADYDYQE